MHQKSIAALISGLTNREYSSTELTNFFLDRINRFNPKLNSFITITPEAAIAQAKALDHYHLNNISTPLAGIPCAHKDNLCTKNIKTTCASKMLDNFIAPYDATVVERMNNAGVVMVGKTNLDEFSMGSSNETSYYGPVKNPWNLQCVPGGSSGGSAAAVAARLVPFATATDSGGSLRQPASLCGVTGLKPTYGAVSRYGIIAFSSSLDQAGIIARSAKDIALLLPHLIGFDQKDATSIDNPPIDYSQSLERSLQGIKIGLPKEYFEPGIETGVAIAIDNAIRELEKLGAIISEISLPHTHLAIPTYYVIAPAECSSNLERFDGVRYGYRCSNPDDLSDLYQRTRGEGFGSEVKRRIMLGTYVLSAGYHQAYYRKAEQVRGLIRSDFLEAFTKVDAIMSPTSPTTAFKIGEKTTDPVKMYLSDIDTVAVNLAGLPALTFPVGFANGLPVGAQLIGHYFCEAQILNIAHCYQQITDWHNNIPEGFE